MNSLHTHMTDTALAPQAGRVGDVFIATCSATLLLADLLLRLPRSRRAMN